MEKKQESTNDNVEGFVGENGAGNPLIACGGGKVVVDRSRRRIKGTKEFVPNVPAHDEPKP